MTKLELALFSALLLLAPATLVADDAGKQVFVDQGCNKCHGVTSAGIEATIKSEKMQGPDLDGVGSRHDAEFLSKYVKKEAQLNDKDHKATWKGSDEELAALIGWLETLEQQ